jgi:hypothetical protein
MNGTGIGASGEQSYVDLINISHGTIIASGVTGIGSGLRNSLVRDITISDSDVRAKATDGSGIGDNVTQTVLEDVAIKVRSSDAAGVLISGSVSLSGNVTLNCEPIRFCVDSPSIVLNVSSLLMTTNTPRLFGRCPAYANLSNFTAFYEVVSEGEPVNKSLLHFSNISFVNYTLYNFDVASPDKEFHVPMNSSAYHGFLVYVEWPGNFTVNDPTQRGWLEDSGNTVFPVHDTDAVFNATFVTPTPLPSLTVSPSPTVSATPEQSSTPSPSPTVSMTPLPSSTPSTTPSPGPQKLDKWAIVIMVAAPVTAVAFGVMAFLLCWRRRRRQSMQPDYNAALLHRGIGTGV